MKSKRKRKTTALPKSKRQKVIDIQNKIAGRSPMKYKLMPEVVIDPSLPPPDPAYVAKLKEEMKKEAEEHNE